MLRLTLLLLLGLAFFPVPAQDFNNYRPLRSSGRVPGAFIKTTAEKVKLDIAAARARGEYTDGNKKNFYIESHYVLDRLLQSGKVLTGDPVSEYVNRVADTLLRKDPELRRQLHIYVIKSPYVNAYTLVDGYIFVNIGLLAQLENEAQLAYILSHEIVHYKNKHSLNTFLEYLKIDRRPSSSYNDQTEAKLEYSKDQEIEADMQGLEIFLRSGYSLDAVMTAFDVMQYSYLPFDEVPFEKSVFEDEHLKLPESYLLKETKTISNDDNFDDSKSTHPNIRRRKQSLQPEVEKSVTGPGKKKFILPEDEFRRVQTIARFETCRLQLLNREYPEAIYSSFLLQKKYPNSIYLKKITGKALYNIAAYWSYINSETEASDIFWESRLGGSRTGRWSTPDFEDVEGSSQQVYHILKRLDNDEAAVIALNYNWRLHKQYPKDDEIRKMCDSLFFILSFRHNQGIGDYSVKSRSEMLREKMMRDSLSQVAKNDTAETGSKYEKIRLQQQKTLISEDNEKFTYFAFVSFAQDEEFRARFQRMSEIASKRKEKDERSVRTPSRSLPALGIDKVVVVEPFLLTIDERKRDNQLLYLESEIAQEELLSTLKTLGQSTRLETVLIDPQHLDTTNASDYNAMSQVKEWVTERMKQGNAGMALVIGSDSAQSLSAKYGTDYFFWTGVVSVRKKKKAFWPATLLGGGLVLVAAGQGDPSVTLVGASGIALGGLALFGSPAYRTLYYSMLFNIESGEIIYSTYKETRGKPTKAQMTRRYGPVMGAIKKKK